MRREGSGLGVRALLLAWAWLMLPTQNGAASAASPPCGALARLAEQQAALLEAEYREKSAGRNGLRRREDGASTAPFLLPGDSRVVLLLHGFMASPPEMEPLARFLHEESGATIYVPLLPGFGGPPEAMKQVRLPRWQQHVEAVLEAAARCGGEVAVVGYSLGGGLVVDRLLAAEESSALSSLVLLSPFIRGAPWQLSRLGASAGQVTVGTLRHVFRVQRIRLQTIYRWSRGRYRDLEILLEDAFVYDQSLALRGALDMLALSKNLRRQRRARVQVPTLLVLSEADRTIDRRAARRYVERGFPNLQEVHVLPREAAVPHQVVVPHERLHPEAAAVFVKVLDFLEAHWSHAGSSR